MERIKKIWRINLCNNKNKRPLINSIKVFWQERTRLEHATGGFGDRCSTN